MKSPWANTALLFILTVLTITGYLGLVSGQEDQAWRLWAHGIAAYAHIVLFVWKSAIILDAYRRKNKWTRQRIIFAILLLMLILTVGLGLLWTFIGPLYFAGFSLVSLHIYIAVPLMGILVYHAWKQRFIFRVKGALGRRVFLGAGLTIVLGFSIRQTAAYLQKTFDGGRRRFSGSYEQGSFGGRFPVVSWINDNPPAINFSSWRIKINSAALGSMTYTYEQLLALPQVEKEAVLDCTGGWYTRQIWTGVPLDQLFKQIGISESAKSIVVHSITGYKRRFPLEDSEHMLLAYFVAGQPLTHGHGAPLRLVIPGERGMEWVKWVTEVEINVTIAAWQSPLPLS